MDESSSSGKLSSQPGSEHFRDFFFGAVGVTDGWKSHWKESAKTRLSTARSHAAGWRLTTRTTHTSPEASVSSPRNVFSSYSNVNCCGRVSFSLSRTGTNRCDEEDPYGSVFHHTLHLGLTAEAKGPQTQYPAKLPHLVYQISKMECLLGRAVPYVAHKHSISICSTR